MLPPSYFTTVSTKHYRARSRNNNGGFCQWIQKVISICIIPERALSMWEHPYLTDKPLLWFVWPVCEYTHTSERKPCVVSTSWVWVHPYFREETVCGSHVLGVSTPIIQRGTLVWFVRPGCEYTHTSERKPCVVRTSWSCVSVHPCLERKPCVNAPILQRENLIRFVHRMCECTHILERSHYVVCTSWVSTLYLREEPLRGSYILCMSAPTSHTSERKPYVSFLPCGSGDHPKPDRVSEQPPSIGFNVPVPNSAFYTPNGRLHPPASERLPVGLKWKETS